MPRTAIFETIPFEPKTITEVEVNGQKYMRVSGVFGRADERNANNRIYPSKLIERETRNLSERSGKDTVFMQADHPSDGQSRISDTAAILRSVSYDPATKEVIGEADVLPTHKGGDLASIIRAGGKVGISARGFGTVSAGEHAGQKGDIVNEDYKLVTYDFVVGQSTRGAVVSSFAEQAEAIASLEETDMSVDLKTISIDAFKAARPDIVTAIAEEQKAAAKTEAEKNLADRIAEKSDEIEAKLRKELKLEKKNKKDDEDDEDDDEMDEMAGRAARLGYNVEAFTASAKSRYGGGKGRNGKGKEDDAASDADDEKCEAELVAWAKAKNIKLEKKAPAGGGDSKVEEQFKRVEAQLRDTKLVLEQTEQRSKALEERNATNDVKTYIFEKVKGDGYKFKNALTERLLEANLKTTAEVDARIPVEKAAIDRLMAEASGAGVRGNEEPRGSEGTREDKTFKTKDGKTLTEAQIRQRDLAGLKTDLLVG